VRPTENYNRFVDGIDFEGSHFLTTPHDLHRARRKPLEPYFSRQGIAHFEPVIQELAQKLEKRFRALEGTHSIVRLDHALVCYTGDMISRVCCEQTTSLLDAEDFSKDWYDSLHTIIKSMPLFEALPWLIRVVRLIPKSVLTWLDPRSQLFNDWRDMAEDHVIRIKAAGKRADPISTGIKRTTVLHDLVYSDMPESELSTSRLVNEAQVLLAAGTIGTARVLDLMCFYIVANPAVHRRLGEELTDVMANYPITPPTWTQLEKLPYLQAVIKEGLR
jgi:cytochrome P450